LVLRIWLRRRGNAVAVSSLVGRLVFGNAHRFRRTNDRWAEIRTRGVLSEAQVARAQPLERRAIGSHNVRID
jgi:hypothetical protein